MSGTERNVFNYLEKSVDKKLIMWYNDIRYIINVIKQAP